MANYRLPLSQLETIQAVIAGPPEHVAAALGRYIAAGARHLALRIAAPSLRAQRDGLVGRLGDGALAHPLRSSPPGRAGMRSAARVVCSMILVSASSWRIITAGMPRPAWRIFSNARSTSRS